MRGSSDEIAAKAFGGRLFDTVFAGPVGACFRSSRDDARRQRAGLRIRLRLNNVPALADLPWEHLYDVRLNQFLSLTDQTPVVRYLELARAIAPVALDLPLRVLMMVRFR